MIPWDVAVTLRETCICENRTSTAIVRYALVYLDRKSTRLNSSHMSISYAVFCLKKKKKNQNNQQKLKTTQTIVQKSHSIEEIVRPHTNSKISYDMSQDIPQEILQHMPSARSNQQ